MKKGLTMLVAAMVITGLICVIGSAAAVSLDIGFGYKPNSHSTSMRIQDGVDFYSGEPANAQIGFGYKPDGCDTGWGYKPSNTQIGFGYKPDGCDTGWGYKPSNTQIGQGEPSSEEIKRIVEQVGFDSTMMRIVP